MTTIRCHHCKGTHDSVAAVYECAMGEVRISTPPKSSGLPPTPKQVQYALDLLTAAGEGAEIDRDAMSRMTREEVSAIIERLNKHPAGSARRPRADKPDVPAGRYAIPAEDPADKWDFIQVDKPTEGKWAGRTFTNRLLGAPGHYRRVRLSWTDELRALHEVALDPAEASKAYGRESGVCGVCSSPLTNADSLAAGIGPVCRGKLGW